jgi:hypothetical protein
VKRGIPAAPVQLENVGIAHYLDSFRVLLLTYQGMKPLSPEVHTALADWVRAGGALVVCDDDSDPFNQVREWWNSGDSHYATPREHLFEKLGLKKGAAGPKETGEVISVGKGQVCWLKESPVRFAADAADETRLIDTVQNAAGKVGVKWKETHYLSLRRGPYLIAAGLDESIEGEPKALTGSFVNLFDSELRVQNRIQVTPGSRFFLLDLESVKETDRVLASACKVIPGKRTEKSISMTVDGIVETSAVILFRTGRAPTSVELNGKPVETTQYSKVQKLLWIRFPNEPGQRELIINF